MPDDNVGPIGPFQASGTLSEARRQAAGGPGSRPARRRALESEIKSIVPFGGPQEPSGTRAFANRACPSTLPLATYSSSRHGTRSRQSDGSSLVPAIGRVLSVAQSRLPRKRAGGLSIGGISAKPGSHIVSGWVG